MYTSYWLITAALLSLEVIIPKTFPLVEVVICSKNEFKSHHKRVSLIRNDEFISVSVTTVIRQHHNQHQQPAKVSVIGIIKCRKKTHGRGGSEGMMGRFATSSLTYQCVLFYSMSRRASGDFVSTFIVLFTCYFFMVHHFVFGSF